MKKLTVLALLASLSVAAPALAQTPADIKNFRDGSNMSAPTETAATIAPAPAHETTKKKSKHSKSSKTSSKHSSKKKHTSKTTKEGVTETTKTESKTETHTEKK